MAKRLVALTLAGGLLVACGSDADTATPPSTSAPSSSAASSAVDSSAGESSAAPTDESTAEATDGSSAAPSSDPVTSDAAPSGEEKVFVFGSSDDPKTLDAAYVSDGESLRVIFQVYETLVALAPGTTDVVPGLATDWTVSEDGLSYVFNIRPDVKFHDGEALDAAAVCFNFDRWYNFKDAQQSPDVSYYWQTIFGGFATQDNDAAPATSRYKSCEAEDLKVTLNLTEASSALLSGLVLPSFSIASPKAITEGGDELDATGESIAYTGGFGNTVVAGTGPFKFVSWERGQSLVLERNDDYWGAAPALSQIIFQPIAEPTARLQALQAGEIDAYEGVDAADIDAITGSDSQVVERPAFNVGYVGFNNQTPLLKNPKIRQAISQALNRQGLLDAAYPAGAQLANEFMPPTQWGYNTDIAGYTYDPEAAKALIAESGETDLNIEFWYPADVSRPYMPNPQAVYESFAADLTAVGFTVTPKTQPWTPDYLQSIQADGKGQLFLLGWTGDYSDPDNFVGTFFREKKPDFGLEDAGIQDLLKQALAETDQAAREALYKEANQKIFEFIPGVPFVHNQPLLALSNRVTGYTPSPVSLEYFSLVDIQG